MPHLDEVNYSFWNGCFAETTQILNDITCLQKICSRVGIKKWIHINMGGNVSWTKNSLLNYVIKLLLIMLWYFSITLPVTQLTLQHTRSRQSACWWGKMRQVIPGGKERVDSKSMSRLRGRIGILFNIHFKIGRPTVMKFQLLHHHIPFLTTVAKQNWQVKNKFIKDLFLYGPNIQAQKKQLKKLWWTISRSPT